VLAEGDGGRVRPPYVAADAERGTLFLTGIDDHIGAIGGLTGGGVG
jgi:hypothetical protein